MDLIGSLVIAFSMYSKIPMPTVSWTEKRMRYAVCFFPLVGAVMGALLQVLFWGLSFIPGDRRLLTAVLGTVWPIVITGGIHMDGFLDVTDARHSWGDREKKLEILKDPHVGAFAVAGCGVYLLLYLAAFSLVTPDMVLAVGGVYVATRAMSGLALVFFEKAREDGLAVTFSKDVRKKTAAAAMGVYLAAGMGAIAAACGMRTAVLAAVLCVFLFANYRRMSAKEFGGITGDLAGYFLQTSELALLWLTAVCRCISGGSA